MIGFMRRDNERSQVGGSDDGWLMKRKAVKGGMLVVSCTVLSHDATKRR